MGEGSIFGLGAEMARVQFVGAERDCAGWVAHGVSLAVGGGYRPQAD